METQSPLGIDRQRISSGVFIETCSRLVCSKRRAFAGSMKANMAAQVFPSKGQEAIAIGCCLALEKGDDGYSIVSHPRRDGRHGHDDRGTDCARSFIARGRPEDRAMRRIKLRGRSWA